MSLGAKQHIALPLRHRGGCLSVPKRCLRGVQAVPGLGIGKPVNNAESARNYGARPAATAARVKGNRVGMYVRVRFRDKWTDLVHLRALPVLCARAYILYAVELSVQRLRPLMTAWSRPCAVCARLQRSGQKGAVHRFVSAPPTVAAVIWSTIK